jgi:hypothetical protein
MLRLEEVSGGSQFVGTGQGFQPVTFRVTDSSADPVRGATVAFQLVIGRPQQNAPVVWLGDGIIGRQPMPVILGSTQSAVISDGNGLASLQPSAGGFVGPLVFEGTATAGTISLPFQLQSFMTMQTGLLSRESEPLVRAPGEVQW